MTAFLAGALADMTRGLWAVCLLASGLVVVTLVVIVWQDRSVERERERMIWRAKR